MNPDTEKSCLDLPGDNKPRLTHADPGLTYRWPCNPKFEIPRYPSHFPLGSPLLFSNVGPGLVDVPDREGKIHIIQKIFKFRLEANVIFEHCCDVFKRCMCNDTS